MPWSLRIATDATSASAIEIAEDAARASGVERCEGPLPDRFTLADRWRLSVQAAMCWS